MTKDLTLYRIKDWAVHFENNRTKELKNMIWVPMPTKHDGDGYTELLDHPNGAAHFGAWCACVQVAAKSHPRGTLLRAGNLPHDPASLSRITRIPPQVFSEVLPRLVSIGWVETCPIPQEGATLPQEGAALLCNVMSSSVGLCSVGLVDEIYDLYPATRSGGGSTLKAATDKKTIRDLLEQGVDVKDMILLYLRKTDPEYIKNFHNFLTTLPDRGELEKADDWL